MLLHPRESAFSTESPGTDDDDTVSAGDSKGSNLDEICGEEKCAEELNALGDERWEVFWIEPAPGGLRVYLKRPSVSYLSRVPLTTLLRLLAIGA